MPPENHKKLALPQASRIDLASRWVEHARCRFTWLATSLRSSLALLQMSACDMRRKKLHRQCTYKEAVDNCNLSAPGGKQLITARPLSATAGTRLGCTWSTNPIKGVWGVRITIVVLQMLPWHCSLCLCSIIEFVPLLKYPVCAILLTKNQHFMKSSQPSSPPPKTGETDSKPAANHSKKVQNKKIEVPRSKLAAIPEVKMSMAAVPKVKMSQVDVKGLPSTVISAGTHCLTKRQYWQSVDIILTQLQHTLLLPQVALGKSLRPGLVSKFFWPAGGID